MKEKKPTGSSWGIRRLLGEEIDLGFLSFFFYSPKLPPTLCEFFFPQKFKISPFGNLFWLIFIGKMLLGSQNWSLIFFFLVNFDFSYFFVFLKNEQNQRQLNEKNQGFQK